MILHTPSRHLKKKNANTNRTTDRLPLLHADKPTENADDAGNIILDTKSGYPENSNMPVPLFRSSMTPQREQLPVYVPRFLREFRLSTENMAQAVMQPRVRRTVIFMLGLGGWEHGAKQPRW